MVQKERPIVSALDGIIPNCLSSEKARFVVESN